MISERLRKKEVYASRPIKEAKWVIDELTKQLIMCVESMVRDGICTQEEAEEIVLTSMEKCERRLHALSDYGFENYMRTEIAKVELAKELMTEGALR